MQKLNTLKNTDINYDRRVYVLLIIGVENCSRCKMTKSILDNKKIDYTYKLNNEISEEEFNTYMDKAKIKGLMNFPLIIKDEEIIVLEDVVK